MSEGNEYSIVTVYSFLLPIIAGLAVLVFGVTWAINSWNAPTGLQKTQGTVVSMQGGVKYPTTPVVEYQVDGKTYSTSGSVHVMLSRLSIGKRVTVLYSPGNPEYGRIHSFGETWAVPLIIGGRGLFCIVVFGYAFLALRRQYNESQTR